MSDRDNRDFHEQRAERHLELASRTNDMKIKITHLDEAARHATLASLSGDGPVCPLDTPDKYAATESA